MVDSDHYKRMMINSVIMIIGYGLAALGAYMSIYIFMIAAVLIGITSALGEVTVMGYLGLLPTKYMSSFVGGTGCAGISGNIFYLVSHAVLKLKDSVVFSIMIICGILYLVCFVLIIKYTGELRNKKWRKANLSVNKKEISSEGQYSPGLEVKGQFAEINVEGEEKVESLEEKKYSESSKINYEPGSSTVIEKQTKKLALINSLYYIVIWFFVFFCDYGTNVGFSDRIGDNLINAELNKGFLRENFYIIGQFSAQIGILLGRNSFNIFRLNRLYVFMVIAIMIYCIMFYCTLYMWNINPLILFTFIFISGIQNGWGYVFTLVQVLNDQSIQKINKEFIMNFLYVFADIGAGLSMILFLVYDHTFLKEE